MNPPKENVKVSIMQREFTVACTAEESQSVVAAAEYLDKQMRTVSKGKQVLSGDRCAIMAGLNISHELLALRQAMYDQSALDSRLENLHQQVEQAVTSIRTVG